MSLGFEHRICEIHPESIKIRTFTENYFTSFKAFGNDIGKNAGTV